MVCDVNVLIHRGFVAQVLILILLEYGLRRNKCSIFDVFPRVLILILLEYGLRQFVPTVTLNWKLSLNPYSTGIWSATDKESNLYAILCEVLILILLEYGLRPGRRRPASFEQRVLILILLEYGLRLVRMTTTSTALTCLNPYSTGIWSATLCAYFYAQKSDMS